MAQTWTIWIDADGLASAEYQTMVETLSDAKRERKDLLEMDCGKIVIVEHASETDADMFVEFVTEYDKPVKVATLWAKFCLMRVTG